MKISVTSSEIRLPHQNHCRYNTSAAAQLMATSVMTNFVQIVIMVMYQNGRDTHVRQVKVFGPRARDDWNGGVPGNGMGEYGFRRALL
jgi:hypothetical protein